MLGNRRCRPESTVLEKGESVDLSLQFLEKGESVDLSLQFWKRVKV